MQTKILFSSVYAAICLSIVFISSAFADCTDDFVKAFRSEYNIDVHNINAEAFYSSYCKANTTDLGFKIMLPIDDVPVAANGTANSHNSECAMHDTKYFNDHIDKSTFSFIDPSVALGILARCRPDPLTLVAFENSGGIHLTAYFSSQTGIHTATVTSIGVEPEKGAKAGVPKLAVGDVILPGGSGANYTRKTQKDLTFSLQTNEGEKAVVLPGQVYIRLDVEAIPTIDVNAPGKFGCGAKVFGSPDQLQSMGPPEYCSSLGIKNCNIAVLSGYCRQKYGVAVRIPAATRQTQSVIDSWGLYDVSGDSWRCVRNKVEVGDQLSYPGESDKGKLAACASMYSFKDRTEADDHFTASDAASNSQTGVPIR